MGYCGRVIPLLGVDHVRITPEPRLHRHVRIQHQLILFLPRQLTDDVKKEKEKEPEKTDQPLASLLKKKGFEEEKKDSDDSDDVSALGQSLHTNDVFGCPVRPLSDLRRCPSLEK